MKSCERRNKKKSHWIAHKKTRIFNEAYMEIWYNKFRYNSNDQSNVRAFPIIKFHIKKWLFFIAEKIQSNV